MPVASLFPWKALPRGLVSQRVLEDADCVDAVKGVRPPPCGVYGAEANVAHSVLSQCFSSLGPHSLAWGKG